MVAIVVAGSKAEVAGCHDRLTQRAQRHLADDNLRHRVLCSLNTILSPLVLLSVVLVSSIFLLSFRLVSTLSFASIILLLSFASYFHPVFRFSNLLSVFRFLFSCCFSVLESWCCLWFVSHHASFAFSLSCHL